MKIAFFGSDYFLTCLEAIERQGHSIVGIFSQPCDNERFAFNRKVEDFASRINLRMRLDRPGPDDIAALIDGGCDMLISAAYRSRFRSLRCTGSSV